jgi:arginine exporter protein ArgO
MWKGHILEILGLGLVVTAFLHYDPSTTAWINVAAGAVIAVLGTSLWHTASRRGLTANILGLALLLAALIPPLRIHHVNTWIAGLVGVMAWMLGRRVVASESGGPWRLKDRPIY